MKSRQAKRTRPGSRSLSGSSSDTCFTIHCCTPHDHQEFQEKLQSLVRKPLTC